MSKQKNIKKKNYNKFFSYENTERKHGNFMYKNFGKSKSYNPPSSLSTIHLLTPPMRIQYISAAFKPLSVCLRASFCPETSPAVKQLSPSPSPF